MSNGAFGCAGGAGDRTSHRAGMWKWNATATCVPCGFGSRRSGVAFSTTVLQVGHECEEDHHAAAPPSLNVVSRAGEAQQGLFNDLGRGRSYHTPATCSCSPVHQSSDAILINSSTSGQFGHSSSVCHVIKL
jgi:hypothetical protein